MPTTGNCELPAVVPRQQPPQTMFQQTCCDINCMPPLHCDNTATSTACKYMTQTLQSCLPPDAGNTMMTSSGPNQANLLILYLSFITWVNPTNNNNSCTAVQQQRRLHSYVAAQRVHGYATAATTIQPHSSTASIASHVRNNS